MTDTTELVLLRLALIGVIFGFIMVAAVVLRSGLSPRARRRAPGRAGARLVVLSPARTGLAAGAEFPLAGETTIGRDDTSGIVLLDPSVSGRHAALERTADGWIIRDFRSTNGTLADGRSVDERGVTLRDGHEVQVGVVRFRFHG